MAERTGTVVKVTKPEEGTKQPYKFEIKTEEGKNLKVTAWKRIGSKESPRENPAAKVSVGDYGTFTGKEEDESFVNDDGETVEYTKFFANNFTAKSPPLSVNGQYPSSQGTPRSALEITATEVMGFAKDLVVPQIATGAFKSDKEIISATVIVYEDLMTAIRQTVAPPTPPASEEAPAQEAVEE